MELQHIRRSQAEHEDDEQELMPIPPGAYIPPERVVGAFAAAEAAAEWLKRNPEDSFGSMPPAAPFRPSNEEELPEVDIPLQRPSTETLTDELAAA